jgi:flagellar basal-body rod protein FlgB
MLDRVSQQLEKYMDLVATRQKLVAANIANIDTPGYRELSAALHTSETEISPGQDMIPLDD